MTKSIKNHTPDIASSEDNCEYKPQRLSGMWCCRQLWGGVFFEGW
jgi:hypothetical protein